MRPAITRPRRTPSIIPVRMIENANALRAGGARSAASGTIICGVRVVAADRNERASKRCRLEVTARPRVKKVVTRIRTRMSWRR